MASDSQYQTVKINGEVFYKFTNPQGKTEYSDTPPGPDQILQPENSGGGSAYPAVCDNHCKGRIKALQDKFNVTPDQAAEMYQREEASKAKTQKDIEEALENERHRQLLEEEAELAQAEEALSAKEIAKDILLPQTKMDYAILLAGPVFKVAKKGRTLYKVLNKEKALASIQKRRREIKELIEALKAKKAGKGLYAEQKAIKRMERFEVKPCFKRGAGNKASIAEYERQLAAQEKALNDMSIGDYQKARDFYKKNKRHPGADSANAEFRAQFQKDQQEKLFNQKLRAGIAGAQAKTEAIKEAADMMVGLEALHTPDLVAGGDFRPTDMGNSSANRSIGGQWPQKGRIQSMDKAAEDAAKSLGKDAKMNVKLARCK